MENSILESKIRKTLKRDGYILRRSRTRNINPDNLGQYMVIDASMNCVVLGSRYDASLSSIWEWMNL